MIESYRAIELDIKRKRDKMTLRNNNKVNATEERERSLTETQALLRNERDIHPPLGERKRGKECVCVCVCVSSRGGYDYSADLAPTLSYG